MLHPDVGTAAEHLLVVDLGVGVVGGFAAPPFAKRSTQMHCRVVCDAGLPTPLFILQGWFIMSSKVYGGLI